MQLSGDKDDTNPIHFWPMTDSSTLPTLEGMYWKGRGSSSKKRWEMVSAPCPMIHAFVCQERQALPHNSQISEAAFDKLLFQATHLEQFESHIYC